MAKDIWFLGFPVKQRRHQIVSFGHDNSVQQIIPKSWWLSSKHLFLTFESSRGYTSISFGGCDPDHKSGSGLLHVFIHFRTHPSGLKGAAFTWYLLFWWPEDQVGTCCTSSRVWLGFKGIRRKDFPGSKGKKKERKEKKKICTYGEVYSSISLWGHLAKGMYLNCI